MAGELNRALTTATAKLLRPLVRVLLRNGISYGYFADLAKRAFVDVATEDFAIPGRKQTNSRVAILTGLSRKEVLRVKRLAATTADADFIERYNRAARVINGWVTDPRFVDAAGNPRTLPIDGTAGFEGLVKRHGADVPVRAVMDELERVGVLERLADSQLRLVANAYLPAADEFEKINLLGTDVADLITTIDHNLRVPPAEALLQRTVAYDNVPDDSLSEFRLLSRKHAQQLLERLDNWLAEHDRDRNADVEGSGRNRVGLGIYYFDEDLQHHGREDSSN